MTISARASRVALGLVVVLIGTRSVTADDKPGVEAKAAFARLKTLAGEWKVAELEGVHAQHDGKITYKVTAGGSTVMETFFPGSDHEMVSMYHLDGDELVLTHYCAAKNQPRMKLDRQASTPDQYLFVFDGGTGFDPAKDLHIHSGEIKFLEAGKVEATWNANVKGKKAMSSTFSMSRP
jgi:hypothetical protein